MDPFDTLNDEHRLIERVMDAFLLYTARLGAGADPSDLTNFLVLFEELVDGRHHAKEEKILFEAMARAGFPRDTGPIATMLQEHAEFRKLLSELDEAAKLAAVWTRADREMVDDTARELVILLRAHIHKEDAILYPMASHNLSSDAVAAMALRFAEVEGSASAVAERAAFRAMADILGARYSVTRGRGMEPAAAVLN